MPFSGRFPVNTGWTHCHVSGRGGYHLGVTLSMSGGGGSQTQTAPPGRAQVRSHSPPLRNKQRGAFYSTGTGAHSSAFSPSPFVE